MQTRSSYFSSFVEVFVTGVLISENLTFDHLTVSFLKFLISSFSNAIYSGSKYGMLHNIALSDCLLGKREKL